MDINLAIFIFYAFITTASKRFLLSMSNTTPSEYDTLNCLSV